jgi:2,5-dichlorohydroquinone reductive dechlorinase
MTMTELQQLVAGANANLTDKERNCVVGDSAGGAPRFEVYHFALSLCSQKVRTVLAEKQASYVSHDVQILPPSMENYYPGYVKLRAMGGEAMADRMVGAYTGRSSTESEGFDPCVVPTVVDHKAGKVLVDSKAICLYLDKVIEGGSELVPSDIADEVQRQVSIVDRTPHVAVLYGANPDGDVRPDFIQTGMVGIHDFKVTKLRENMKEVGDDEKLIAAYEHKIQKETAAKHFVQAPDDMRAAISEIKQIVGELDRDLKSTSGDWVCGDRYTLADAVWAVSLFRLKWLGMGYIWEAEGAALDRIADYAKRLFDRPSFQQAVIHWPRNPPSKYVEEYYA